MDDILKKIECDYFLTKEYDYTNNPIKIFISPSDKDIKYIKELYDNNLRGIIFPKGDRIYLWDSILRHADIIEVMDKSHPHFINIHDGQRFHIDDAPDIGWGWDFDYGGRFDLNNAKNYLKTFQSLLERFGDLKKLPIYLWGIKDLGPGPFSFTYSELFD